MVIDSYSPLKKIVGRQTYDEIKKYARKIIPIATCILVVLWVLSLIFHLGFISSLLNLTTGTSLIFIAYVIGLIFLLDKGIDVALDENTNINSVRSYSFPKEAPKGFKKILALEICLFVLGISAIVFSNIYRKQYAFECNTFLVDNEAEIYHLDCNDCELASEASDLEKMKGYQINKSYTFCSWCEDWAEDAESDYESNKYFRRY